jgi:multiple sugar transport system permease protein
MKPKSGALKRQANLYGFAFIAPAIILIIIFNLYPIWSGLWLSFFEWDGVRDKVFIGLDNYAALFRDKGFYTSLINTVYFTVGTVPVMVFLSIVFAVLLNMKIKGAAIFRGIYFLPTITSMVAIAVIWRWIYNADSGILNMMLYQLGLPTPGWLTSTKYAMPAIIIMSIWKSIGSNIVIMLAGLQSIPGTLYEAAEIDGANAFHKFWRITLPMLSPTTFFVTVISIIGSFQVFEQALVLTSGGPGNATLVMVYYIYRQAFENFNLGYASALAYVLFISILIVTIIQWVAQKYWVQSEVD